MTAPNRNTLWGRVLADELARAGLRHVTMAPGSRSTPLVLAFADHPDLQVHVHLDERSAAFHALGVGKAMATPAAVVTTSGTAAVNLHPAVIEAHQSHTPLVCLTADRPPHLRGTDANQTIDQVKLYGDTVNAYHELPEPRPDPTALERLRSRADRIVADALGTPAGPVHVNAPFEKPLEPTPVEDDVPDGFGDEAPLAVHGREDGAPFTRIQPRRATPDPGDLDEIADALAAAERPLLVAGPTPRPGRLAEPLLELASTTGAPLLADPTSGTRFTPGASEHALGAYDLFLRSQPLAQALAPDLILRFGTNPTSTATTAWLADQTQARRILLDAGRRFPDHRAWATDRITADPALAARALARTAEPTGDKAWKAPWREAEARTRRILDETLTEAPFEGTVLARAAARVPDGGQLVAGNSMPVRDLDAFATPRDADVRVVANRGASGIDGLVSTALGAADASGRPTVAVIGDLSLLHDVNGLHALGSTEAPLVLVVVNNDGGGIFHKLPIREHEGFTRYFATPHGRDLAHAAALYDLDHERLEDPTGLDEALDQGLGSPGGQLVEVLSDREENQRRHEAVAERVARAVETIPDR